MRRRPPNAPFRALAGALFLIFPAFLNAQDAYWLEPRLNTNPQFQYTPGPDDWRDINIYQIFTDRFFDGDTGNNNVRTMRSGTGWYGEQTNGKSWHNTGNSANAALNYRCIGKFILGWFDGRVRAPFSRRPNSRDRDANVR